MVSSYQTGMCDRGAVEPAARPVVVRAAQVADAAAVVDVQIEAWRAAYAGIVPDGFLRAMSAAERISRVEHGLRALRPAERHAVAEATGDVVGFLRCGACRDDDLDPRATGEVWALYVRPAWWDRGVGRALLGDALAWLAASAFSTATLWVLEANTRARRFYRRSGFAEDGGHKVLDLGGPVAEVRDRRALAAAQTAGSVRALHRLS